MTRSIAIAAVVVSLVHTAALSGQVARAGDRVRVRLVDAGPTAEWTEGRLLRVSGDTMWYGAPDGPAPIVIGRHEASIGRSIGGGNGLVLGAVAGAVIGKVMAETVFKPEPVVQPNTGNSGICGLVSGCSSPSAQSPDNGNDVIMIGLIGGALGGWLVGRHVWNWTPLDLAASPSSGGGVQVSLSYRLLGDPPTTPSWLSVRERN